MRIMLQSFILCSGIFFCLTCPVFAERWEPLPWISAASSARGFIGGEGGQVIKAVAMSPAAPDFIIAGTDVGGLYRSDNGGKDWEPANRNYSPGGGNAFAIDPVNPDRIVVVGCNSSPATHMGLWLSTNRGRSWKMVLGLNVAGQGDLRNGQIDFDPTSYNTTTKMCRRAYWSRESAGHADWGTPDIHGALYKTEDGGEHWTEIDGSSIYGEGMVRVQPRSGVLWVGTNGGLFKSTTQGTSFTKVLNDSIAGIDIPTTFADSVYVSTRSGKIILITSTATTTLSVSGSNGLPKASDATNAEFWHIAVSPVDPARILISVYGKSAWYDWTGYVTKNGGATWQELAYNMDDLFSPSNGRAQSFHWSYTDKQIAFGNGRGDYMARSTDGGFTFYWYNNGTSATMQGGYFSFNADNPDILMTTTQDYNSALTIDGGATWKMIQFGAGWGGYQYGGYAVNAKVCFAFKAEAWDWRHHISISWNGGTTFEEFSTGTDTWSYMLNGSKVCYSAPGDTNVLFAGAWRSTNQGHTWTLMSDCDGVFTHNPTGSKELIGKKGDHAVRSYDKGATWTALTPDFPQYIEDISYDHSKNRVWGVGGWGQVGCYDVTNSRFISIGSRPADQMGNTTSYSVAVDPQNTDIIYIGGWRGIYKPTTSIVRSINGGQSWQSLTNDSAFGRDGGKEAVCLRVNPKTRYLYVGTMCHGQWKIGPPGSTDPTSVTKPDSKQNASTLSPVTVALIRNNVVIKGLIRTTSPTTLDIRDLAGRLVFHGMISNSNEVAVPSLNGGVYLISISANNLIWSSKVIGIR